MKKKIVIILLLICVCHMSCFALIGCTRKLPWYESGDYIYAVNTSKNGAKEAYLIGLTEQGSKQKYLILPSKIDDIPVTQMGYYHSTGITSVHIPSSGTSYEPSKSDAERFYIQDDCLPILINSIHASIFKPYPKQSVFQFFSTSFQNQELNLWIFADSIVPHENILKEDWRGLSYNYYASGTMETWQLNNVSYMYNYINAPNSGYYWIDSWDNTLIDFIPPKPERDGYIFDGWYKDKASSNIWNFDIDKTGDIIKYSDSEEINISSEIYLYAKWKEN